jgi:RNA polymerase sigma-70 factor (ECF subfamily)
MSSDAATFMELVKRHDPGLRTLAYRLLHDRTAMDDVMQDAYLKAFRGFPGFRGEAEERTWLYRIVYNACIDRLRSERRRHEESLDALTETVTATGAAAGTRTGASIGAGLVASAEDDPGESVARKSDLAAALASLPPDQRAAVLLVDAAGFTYEEAAEVLGVRSGTIASRLHQARSALRTSLAERSHYETF